MILNTGLYQKTFANNKKCTLYVFIAYQTIKNNSLVTFIGKKYNKKGRTIQNVIQLHQSMCDVLIITCICWN